MRRWKSVSHNIDELLEQLQVSFAERVEIHATEKAELAAEIERLQNLLDSVENLQHLSVYESHAMAAGLSLHEWVRFQLNASIRTKQIPVSDAVYNKVCSLAGGRSTSISRLTTSRSMDFVIINAIDNQRIKEDT